MGKQTIAESVEASEILDLLRVIGVDYAQGFGIARPEPFERMLEADGAVGRRRAEQGPRA
jgi:EAL domain-containing protein (putative c-di-GMP-specific phosphodiesterase class I)